MRFFLFFSLFLILYGPSYGNPSPGSGLRGIYSSIKNKSVSENSYNEEAKKKNEVAEETSLPPFRIEKNASERRVERTLMPVISSEQNESPVKKKSPAYEAHKEKQQKTERIPDVKKIPASEKKNNKRNKQKEFTMLDTGNKEQIQPGTKENVQKKQPPVKVTGPGPVLEAFPVQQFKKEAPVFYKGIYLNNAVARSKERYHSLLLTARKHGINALVVDVQPAIPSPDFIKKCEDLGFYIIARVVVFPGGLARHPPGSLVKIYQSAEKAADIGFAEIQLDYIRYSDHPEKVKLNLAARYLVLEEILFEFTKRLRPRGVRIGADIFGRIAFNTNDMIGQKLEIFGHHLDVIYPMLYPSHFYGDRFRRVKPYETILDGSMEVKRRSGKKSVAYIQAFTLGYKESGLGYVKYIAEQIRASHKASTGGFIAWNAASRYQEFFEALKKNEH